MQTSRGISFSTIKSLKDGRIISFFLRSSSIRAKLTNLAFIMANWQPCPKSVFSKKIKQKDDKLRAKVNRMLQIELRRSIIFLKTCELPRPIFSKFLSSSYLFFSPPQKEII